MKKFTYIIIALILLISLTAINVLAGNIDKAKIGQKIFAQAIENNEIKISTNKDDDFVEIDAIIGDCEITDEEMSKVVGERYHDLYYKPSGWSRLHGGYDWRQANVIDATCEITVVIIKYVVKTVSVPVVRIGIRTYKAGNKIYKIITKTIEKNKN